MSNNNEWQEVTDPEELFALKRQGWEIERRAHSTYEWKKWEGKSWDIDWAFRASPPQPKKVKMLGWRDKITGALYLCREGVMTNTFCIRYPKLDDEVEE